MMYAACRSFLSAFAVVVSFTFSAQASPENSELVFGVYPTLSPSQTVEQFTPLNDHLTKSLERPVSLRSAPDFAQFIERTRAGEYDIIFTAPHMGRIAETRDGYTRIAQTGYSLVVVALARKDGPIAALADLKGRKLAIGAKLSMTYQIVDQALHKQGLALGRDVEFVDTASFSNVLEALVRREADAGATSSRLWDGAPPGKHEVLREIWRSVPAPGFLILAHPRVGAAALKRIERAVLDFGKTPAGKTFFEITRHVDFRPVDAASMKRIDPYTAVFDKQ
ncbi:MAG: phosphate/phosphite/phosphonate ABC transporter substrate-binding protein [Rhodocyclaceae bacterium]|nr:phosphate/phosphite/phosphonate ABC transporter substrate-binding protein [Rhodocyclaceae bacterium]